MAEKLRKYLDTAKQGISGRGEEIILHRLYYLTGKYFLDSIDNLADDDSLLQVMRQSFEDINPAAETQEIQNGTASQEASVSVAPTDDSSAMQICIVVKKSKRNFRYQIGGQEFLFASQYFHNFLTSALPPEDDKKQKLNLLIAELANKQMTSLLADESLSPVQRIENGLFFFKKMGWGDFHLLERELPYLVGVQNLFDEPASGMQENFHPTFFAALLNGVCSSAYNAQTFDVQKISLEQVEEKHKNQCKLFFRVKENPNGIK